jgi:hypothetical protein
VLPCLASSVEVYGIGRLLVDGRTIERSDERTNKLRTGRRTIEERPNDPCASVCLCGRWSGRVWRGESCLEMAWGGMRGGPCPSIYSHGGGLGEG